MKNYYNQVEEILNSYNLFHLKLDIKTQSLPKEFIQEVQTVYDEEFFVSHRGKKHKVGNQLVFTALMVLIGKL